MRSITPPIASITTPTTPRFSARGIFCSALAWRMSLARRGPVSPDHRLTRRSRPSSSRPSGCCRSGRHRCRRRHRPRRSIADSPPAEHPLPINEDQELRDVQERNPHQRPDAGMKRERGSDEPPAQSRPEQNGDESEIESHRKKRREPTQDWLVGNPQRKASHRAHLVDLREHEQPASHVLCVDPLWPNAEDLRIAGKEVRLTQEQLYEHERPAVLAVMLRAIPCAWNKRQSIPAGRGSKHDERPHRDGKASL